MTTGVFFSRVLFVWVKINFLNNKFCLYFIHLPLLHLSYLPLYQAIHHLQQILQRHSKYSACIWKLGISFLDIRVDCQTAFIVEVLKLI